MNLQSLKEHRYLILVVALIGALVLQMGQGEYIYFREAALSVAIAMVFVIVFERRSHRVVALCAGLLAIGAAWFLRTLPELQRHALELVLHLGATIFFALAVAVILRHLFERRAINLDDIVGTVCGYLLAAAAWANLYGAIELVSPGAFSVTGPIESLLAHWHDRESLFIYFSLTTLTSVGYGDVTPVAAGARSAAVLQAVFGQFYIAVVVAQLVGSKLTEARTADSGRGR